jgi:mannose-6-phosphate isomerase-like protein (cupin superfamily)
MQGRAEFGGPGGEVKEIGRNEGIMLPRGTLYNFRALGDEPLVLLRVGAVVDAAQTPWGRTDEAGKVLLGNARENNQSEPLLYQDRFFE